jgi:DNA-binding transcriptional ArsR family regulator
MRGDADVAAAAALLAEPARAALVLAVMDDGPLSASELAARAGIAISTASEHLARLVAGGFLAATKSGRHRYYELADADVAAAVEALALVAPQPRVRSLREATRAELLRYARTCYDHLAGQLGVALTRALEHDKALTRHDDTYVLGRRAETRFRALGIDLAELNRLRRPLVRGCLDWSERELHLAGALGAALTQRLHELGWLVRRAGNRSIAVTPAGRAGFASEFSLDVGDGAGRPHDGRRAGREWQSPRPPARRAATTRH